MSLETTLEATTHDTHTEAASQHASLLPKIPVNRRTFFMASLMTGYTMAAGPVNAQAVIKTDSEGLDAREIKVKTKDGEMPAYMARPANKKNPAVVLVSQEIFGVHEYIKDTCRRLAKAGYMAIAPELYARQGDPSKYQLSEIQKLIADIVSKVPDAQVMTDFDACVDWAKANGGDTKKLAITGFCYGGRVTWLYAAHNPNVKTGVAWYGRLAGATTPITPKNPVDLVSSIKVPILGLYGAADPGIPNNTLAQMQEALRAAKNDKCDFVLYPDTPHGFHADFRGSYRKAAAEDGWARLLAWFKANGVA